MPIDELALFSRSTVSKRARRNSEERASNGKAHALLGEKDPNDGKRLLLRGGTTVGKAENLSRAIPIRDRSVSILIRNDGNTTVDYRQPYSRTAIEETVTILDGVTTIETNQFDRPKTPSGKKIFPENEEKKLPRIWTIAGDAAKNGHEVELTFPQSSSKGQIASKYAISAQQLNLAFDLKIERAAPSALDNAGGFIINLKEQFNLPPGPVSATNADTIGEGAIIFYALQIPDPNNPLVALPRISIQQKELVDISAVQSNLLVGTGFNRITVLYDGTVLSFRSSNGLSLSAELKLPSQLHVALTASTFSSPVTYTIKNIRYLGDSVRINPNY